jgi:hypothetical protein
MPSAWATTMTRRWKIAASTIMVESGQTTNSQCSNVDG